MDLNLMSAGNTALPTPHRSREGLGRGFVLALLAHAVLLVGLAIGVNWKTQESPASSAQAELWGKVPQAAAPAIQPLPPPPAKTPSPKIKPAPAPPKPEPPVPDAQIALKKQPKVEKKPLVEDTQELARQRKKQLEDAQKEKAAEKAELEAQAKAEKLEKLEKAKKQEAALHAQRQANLKRMMGQANADGEEEGSSSGSARRSSGPSAGYAGRIKARIKPNVTFTESIDGNPTAVVEVRLSPDGHIISSRIIQSSGVSSWDKAVLRAVEKTEVLPRDTDGTVPERMQLVFRPSET
jgi:colicin import membrane protein